MLITVSLSKKDYENSYKLAKNATLTYPDNPDAWNYLGFSSRKLGKYDESEEAYKKALSIDPKHVGINEYLGELYVVTNRMDLARERLEVLMECNCEEYNELKEIIDGTKKSKYGKI